ncbi:MAG: hypothetical protein ACOYNI_01805 [Acidimicrobiia bacterium]
MTAQSRRSLSLRDLYEAGAEFGEVSRDRAQRLVDHLVTEGKVSQAQAADAVADVVEWSRTRAGRFREAVRGELDDIFRQLRPPSREEFEALAERVEALATGTPVKEPKAKEPKATKPKAPKAASTGNTKAADEPKAKKKAAKPKPAKKSA